MNRPSFAAFQSFTSPPSTLVLRSIDQHTAANLPYELEMASIPLECICCPRKPKFSDVSHLLTHVASKGHLSNYYKLKVRSGSDQAARQTVDAFDQWYSDWGVEELMHERLNLKDKKRIRPRSSAGSRATSRAATPRTNNRVKVRDASVDPRFGFPGLPRIKTEARSTPSLSAANSPHPIYNFPQHVGLVPPGFGWHANYPMLPSQHKNIMQWIGDNQSDGSSLTSLPATESTDSAVGTDETAGTDDVFTVADCSKLKGIIWPGMDIFDSATSEQKRKRNQRKDSSVLERLEHDSTTVEAVEYVYSPLGNLKKSLPITGNPEEDDEYMLSSPVKRSPRKYTRRQESRTALTELDGEYGNTRRTRSSYGQLATVKDEQLEIQLTYGGQKRRRIPIHEDDEDEDCMQPLRPAIVHEYHPPNINLLAQTFPTPQQYSHGHHTSASLARYGSQSYYNKENMLPNINVRPNDQSSYGTTGMGFSMAQYSLSQPVPTYHYNNTYNTVWSNQEAAGMFAHPSQSILDHDALKLSPIKMERHVSEEDDARTITAPPSEV